MNPHPHSAIPRKKLIEVALPLEAINAASAREKSIRHGHPSTLHLWWARRPLAAARAVIFAQMVDDPSANPDLFPTEAKQEKERQRLFRIIEDLVKWENTTNGTVLQRAREEIWQSWRRACAQNADHPRAKELFDRHKLPAFHDPFAGGGALPLEAQRLGLEAYASDLNPVAVLTRHEALARFERLNHGDPDELLANARYLPPDRLRLLRAGLHKITAYKRLFARAEDKYLPTLSVIATSGWHLARRFALCGIINSAGRSQPCHLWNLCPSCSYRQRKKAALAAYLPRFYRTSWFQVTISYVAALGDTIFDEDAVRLCWQAAYQGVRDLQRAGDLRGATTRSELHLERFLPLTYLPHVHAVVDADDIDRAFLAERVFAYRSPDTGQRITFPVSIHHRPLGTEKAFANALSYQGKALDLVTPYEAAWPRAAQNRRRFAPALNHEVDEFLDAFGLFTADTHQVRYLGTCHHATRGTLRVPRAQRAAQRDVVSAILTECNLNTWDEDESEPATVFAPPTS